jgi:NADPH2:quinone reductase
LKAALVRRFGPLEEVSVVDVPDPEPGPGEVVVDVAAAEVNYPDLLVIEGRYQVRPPLPFAPGKAAAGHIAALGPGVAHLALGQAVAVQVEYGAYAEKLRAPASACFPLPAGIPFDEAAALGLAYQTAWFALKERAGFQPGEIVLVLGASGGIGTASIQLARVFGAKAVIGGVRGAANAAFARRAGADHVIDLAESNLYDALPRRIRALTEGHGADIVIDPLGGEVTAAALRALAWCGRLVIVGFAAGEIPIIRANYLLVKNIAVFGLQWSDYRDRAPQRVAEVQQELFRLHVAGQIRPVISRRLPLTDFKDALRAFRNGPVQGKMILTMR